MKKIAIIGHIEFFFSVVLELVRELLISNMHNKFQEELFKLSRPQGQIIDVKCKKTQ